MKKIIIAAGIMCVAAAFAKAEVSIVAFDTAGAGSLSAYISARAEESKSAEIVPEQAGWQAVRVKGLLKGLSSVERAEFMSGMKLMSGSVVALDQAVLERSGLSRARITEILRALGSGREGAASARPVDERPAVTLGQLFLGIPEKVKAEFFDNMKFLNGSVAYVKTEWPEKAIPAGRLSEILDALMPAASGDFGTGSEIGIKMETCEASAKCCQPTDNSWDSSVYD